MDTISRKQTWPAKRLPAADLALRRRIRAKRTALSAVRHIFLIAFSVFSLFPIVYAVLASFKSNREFLLGGSSLLPTVWQFKNYATVWNESNFSLYTFNSVYVAIVSTLAVLLISSMMGYCLERAEFKGKKIVMAAYIGTMFMVGATNIYPMFELFVKVGLNRSLNGLVVARLGGQAMNTFLIIGCLKSIPREIDESAKMDGCSFFRRYWNILLPLMKPMLATIAILTFNAAWNDYMLPMAFTLSNEKLRTLTVAVVALRNELGMTLSPYNLIFAGATISLVPMLVIFALMNRQVIDGIVSGAVKG